MTVNVTKPAINLREKLSELDKPSGIAGQDILKADTPQEVFNYIGAGRRNLIINGCFKVSQRGDYSSATSATSGSFYVDRWASWVDVVTANVQNTTVTINGVTKKALRYTATSSGTGYIGAFTKLETQDLPVGETVIFSCWMRSNNSNARLRSNVQSSADSTQVHTGGGDWEYITWTQTVTGTTNPYFGFITHNGSGVAITSGDYIEVADFQLEVGSVATPFEHRSYGEELALCQRYYWVVADGASKSISNGFYYTSTAVYGAIHFPVAMRSPPSLKVTTGTNYYTAYRNGSPDGLSTFAAQGTTTVGANIYNTTDASGTAGHGAFFYSTDANSFMAFDAEL